MSLGIAEKFYKNVFLDSSINTVRGDGRFAAWSVPSQNFTCANNQYFQVLVNSFSMRRNWYNINFNNNAFFATDGNPATVPTPITIAQGDYTTFADLATAIQAGLVAAYPGATCVFDDPTRKFVIDMSGAATFPANYFFVGFLCKDDSTNNHPSVIKRAAFFNDSYEILGGNPTRDGNNLVNLFGATVGQVIHTSPYVGALNTINEIVIRSSLQGQNFQSFSYERDLKDDTAITPTDILARIPLEYAYYTAANAEFIHYDDLDENFAVIIPQKQINEIILVVTDGKGRLLPEVSSGQSAQGLLSFRACLKFETITQVVPQQHILSPADIKLPNTFSYLS